MEKISTVSAESEFSRIGLADAVWINTKKTSVQNPCSTLWIKKPTSCGGMLRISYGGISHKWVYEGLAIAVTTSATNHKSTCVLINHQD